jgi:NAD(P)-dependent dehydrogenase (short-subunit alcohol dehydrogenase family)
MMKKEVLLMTGAGQIGLAIARRMGYGKKIVIATLSVEQAQPTLETLTNAGFDAAVIQMDMADRESIVNAVKKAQEYGPLRMLVNAAGVSPSQASIEQILKVDLLGTAILLEEVRKVIVPGGCGVTISSQSGWRMKQLTEEEDRALAMTPTDKLLDLEILQPENIGNTLKAYQLAKRCNEKRTMYEAVEWGKRGARINCIAPGIIVTPLAIDEFNGIRGDFYKNMFAKCPAGRPGTADEIADIAELLMSERAQFITGSTFLADGGATASYFYGPLQPGLETGMEEGKQ